jgi:hypothetical protein
MADYIKFEFVDLNFTADLPAASKEFIGNQGAYSLEILLNPAYKPNGSDKNKYIVIIWYERHCDVQHNNNITELSSQKWPS